MPNLMSTEVHAVFGIAAGITVLFSNIPYFFSIRRGNIQPSPVSWSIWTTIGYFLLVSSYASGARNTLWLLIALIISQTIITISIVKSKSSRARWQKLDLICLIGAVLSLLFWLLSGNPLVAILINILMDLLGFIPTLRKTWIAPKSENLGFWFLSFISTIFNLLAIANFSLLTTVFPVYIFLLDGIMLFILTRSPHNIRQVYPRQVRFPKKERKKSFDHI